MISVLARGRCRSPAWRGALFYLAFWSVLAVYEPFLNVHFAHLGLSEREIGILAALMPLAVLLEAPVVSALADGRARRVVTLAALLGGYALVLLLRGFAMAGAPAFLLAAAVVRGLGFGLFYVCTVQLLDRRVPDEWSATVQALLNGGAVGLAPLLISPLAGEICDRLEAAAVFGRATGLVMLAALVVSLATARGLLSAEVRLLAQGSGGR